MYGVTSARPDFEILRQAAKLTKKRLNLDHDIAKVIEGRHTAACLSYPCSRHLQFVCVKVMTAEHALEALSKT
jgi:hypothetical protein